MRLGAADTLLLCLDVVNNESVAAAVRKVKRKYGVLDFLINNAGVGVFIPFQEQTAKDIERQVRTNLEGLMKVTCAFLPHVRKGIINIASAAGKTVYEEMSVYCGSKFGVRGFTQSLAVEYPRLRICCVNPDMTATRLRAIRRPLTRWKDLQVPGSGRMYPCRGHGVEARSGHGEAVLRNGYDPANQKVFVIPDEEQNRVSFLFSTSMRPWPN
jgi:NADP-dependent 3-hydroxy acid dehydrogenase YdfG